MNIYSCVDGNNIDKIIVLFNSVYVNSSNKNLKFYILTDKYTEKITSIPKYLDNIINIKQLNWDNKWKNILDKFNNNFYIDSKWCKNNMNFARFLFFKHFPKVDRVIYLDWDMIVIDDIYKLKSHYDNFQNIIVANCGKQNVFHNIFTREYKQHSKLLSIYTRSKMMNHHVKKIINSLNLEQKDFFKVNAFNAGFYIISNNHFNENSLLNLLEKLIDVQIKFKCFNFGTQVVMNLICLNNRIFIDKKWNHLPNIDNLESLSIIHWNGGKKPWHKDNITEKNNIWYKYYLMIYPEKKNIYKIVTNKKNTIKNEKIKTNNKKIIKKNVNVDLIKFLARR